MGKHAATTEHDLLPLRLANEVPGHHRAEPPVITTPLAVPLLAGQAVALIDVDHLPPTEPVVVIPPGTPPLSHAVHAAVAVAGEVAPYPLRSVLDELFGAFGVDRVAAPRYRRTPVGGAR